MADGDIHKCLICAQSKTEDNFFTFSDEFTPKSPPICHETECLQLAYNAGLFYPRYMRDVETMWDENPYLHSENPLHIVFVAINQKVMPRDSDLPYVSGVVGGR